MASTVGLVPITRAYLARFYDKYPFSPLSEGVAQLCAALKDYCRKMEAGIVDQSVDRVVADIEFAAPHKIDENLWKNREQIEEILGLLDKTHWPSFDNQTLPEIPAALTRFDTDLRSVLKAIEDFQLRSSEKVFNMVMTYLPQDFRGLLVKQQHERSERKRQAEVDAVLSAGGSIKEKYTLLWRQQMDRRRQLVQLGAATGVYKTFVKYLIGVPQVLLDFVRQINDHHGPMEEQRQRYGPPLYQLTTIAVSIRIFLFLWWRTFDEGILPADELLSVLKKSVEIYVSELTRFLRFIGEVFENSPFLISAEEAGASEAIQQADEFKETVIATGKTHEVLLTVECEGSLVAWDFKLTSGKDVGFSVEYIDVSGVRRPMLPYQRYESNQGNFYSPCVGSYRLTWDNTYSTFYRKSLRYKVDTIPPVGETRTAEITLDAIVPDGEAPATEIALDTFHTAIETRTAEIQVTGEA
eukprot:c23683_g1_i1 orf=272-1675(+)